MKIFYLFLFLITFSSCSIFEDEVFENTDNNLMSEEDIIKEKSILRELINISTKTINSANQTDLGDVREVLDKAEQDIFNIAGKTSTNFDLQKILCTLHNLLTVL